LEAPTISQEIVHSYAAATPQYQRLTKQHEARFESPQLDLRSGNLIRITKKEKTDKIEIGAIRNS